jgi:hypothetical protein
MNRVWDFVVESGGLEYGPLPGSCEHGNETSGSIKDGEFFDQQSKFGFWRMTLFHAVGYS